MWGFGCESIAFPWVVQNEPWMFFNEYDDDDNEDESHCVLWLQVKSV